MRFVYHKKITPTVEKPWLHHRVYGHFHSDMQFMTIVILLFIMILTTKQYPFILLIALSALLLGTYKWLGKEYENDYGEAAFMTFPILFISAKVYGLDNYVAEKLTQILLYLN